jgi:hypothetical protein
MEAVSGWGNMIGAAGVSSVVRNLPAAGKRAMVVSLGPKIEVNWASY